MGKYFFIPFVSHPGKTPRVLKNFKLILKHIIFMYTSSRKLLKIDRQLMANFFKETRKSRAKGSDDCEKKPSDQRP